MDLGPVSSAPPAPPCAPVEVSEQRPAAEGLRDPGSRGGRWNADGSAASTRASRTAKEFKTEARAASPLAQPPRPRTSVACSLPHEGPISNTAARCASCVSLGATGRCFG